MRLLHTDDWTRDVFHGAAAACKLITSTDVIEGSRGNFGAFLKKKKSLHFDVLMYSENVLKGLSVFSFLFVQAKIMQPVYQEPFQAAFINGTTIF